MKKAFIITGLSLALITTACGNKDTKDSKVQGETSQKPKQSQELESKTQNSKKTSLEKSLGDYTTRSGMRKLMVASDYISRVKLTQLGDGQTELTILDNYKGSLSNIEFPQPKNLSTNKEYLIFYKDDEDGNIVPTALDAVVEVATKNDTILDYVERTYNKSDTTKTKRTQTIKTQEDEEKRSSKSKDSVQKEDKTSSKKTSLDKTSSKKTSLDEGKSSSGSEDKTSSSKTGKKSSKDTGDTESKKSSTRSKKTSESSSTRKSSSKETD